MYNKGQKRNTEITTEVYIIYTYIFIGLLDRDREQKVIDGQNQLKSWAYDSLLSFLEHVINLSN